MMRVNIEVGGGHSLKQIHELVIQNKGMATEDHLPGVHPYQVWHNGVPEPVTVYHNPEEGALALVYRVLEGMLHE